MALSITEKLLKASVLAAAVQILRKDRLKLSQEAFTELLFGEGAYAGYVSRWERGVCAPSPTHRARLAAIARKNGWTDLVFAFQDTVHEWRAIFLSERDRHWLALFELIMLNQPTPGLGRQYQGFKVPRREYAGLVKAFRTAVRAMKSEVTRSGPSVWMATDEQVSAWQQETQPKAVKKTRTARRQSRERVVSQANGRRAGFLVWQVLVAPHHGKEGVKWMTAQEGSRKRALTVKVQSSTANRTAGGSPR